MASYTFYAADVFTDRPFGGNRLAVLPDARGLSEAAMQAIAGEFNWSETVFVLPPETDAGARRLRIFTPTSEIPFAGHPTVGAAFVLAAIGNITSHHDEIEFVLEEGAGPVPVRVFCKGGKPIASELTIPRPPEVRSLTLNRDTLAALLSLEPGDLAPDWEAAIASCGLPFTIIPLADEVALGRSRLNLGLWQQHLAGTEAPHVYPITRLAEATWHVRMFAPALGIAEDPATGSAAAALGGYLAAHLGWGDGLWPVAIEQGEDLGRPSHLSLTVEVNADQVTSVRVGGPSVLVMQGTISLP